MSKSASKSPENTLNNGSIMGSPKNSNSKSYLPSRYAHQRRNDKTGFQDILNSIQLKTGLTSKIKNESSPSLKKDVLTEDHRLKSSKFVTRPLKRGKLDEVQFKEIFLDPREEALDEIIKNSSVEETTRAISKQYDKLLNFDQRITNGRQEEGSTGKPTSLCYNEAIQLLQIDNRTILKNVTTDQVDFYDIHIVIQPPDAPSSEDQKGGLSGSIGASAIPLNFKSYKSSNIKELLMRARVGMNNEDLQKQAHLSYIIAESYSQNKMYIQALKFQRRFLGLAKSMRDIVGMSLGANRVAITYFHVCDYQKSILFHNENLKLSNIDNCFVGFYNIGICYRKLGKINQALEFFESALSWARGKGDEESECIALGQIGVTHYHCNLYEEAIFNIKKSLQIGKKIKKDELSLHNIRYLLRISSAQLIETVNQVSLLIEEAFNYARALQKTKLVDIFRCNMGVSKGISLMKQSLPLYQQANQIQQI